MSKKKKSAIKPDATKKYFNPRVRGELWDVDYLHTLSPKDQEYYKKFMSEWANASVETVKDPLIMEYAKVNNLGYKIAKKEMIGGGYTPIKREGAPKKGHLHKTKEHAKEIFKKNNQTNNDIFGVTKINNLLEYDLHGSAQRKDVWHETDPGNVEDALIWAMDYKKSKRATKREYRKLNPSKRDLKKQNK